MGAIRWAKKVPCELIRKLYETDAAGMTDDDLADEAGWALCARCDSIIAVTYGYENKRLPCPRCGESVALTDGRFDCGCGFSASWEEFRASYKDKQLYGANALPFFLRYRREFPMACTFREKLLAIDTLLHSFHVLHSYRRGDMSPDFYDENAALGRPVAANLLDCSLGDAVRFLDGLSSVSGIDGHEALLRKEVLKRANGGSSAGS